VSGIELVAGTITAFFAFGIVVGVLAVIALSAMRGHRERTVQRRRVSLNHPDRTDTIDWHRPPSQGRPSGPDWEDRPGWQDWQDWQDWRERRGPADDDEMPPPAWPGRRLLGSRRE
jgi:hypothetical protein